MDDWFRIIAAGSELPALRRRGPARCGLRHHSWPGGRRRAVALAEAYDSAVASAAPDDVSIGSSTTRVHDFVNRGPEFDGLYLHRPLLEACCHVLGRPFRLSTMLGRTLRPRSPAGDLHVDVEPDASGWPMLGFILMVDEFRSDNGATRFVPGSTGGPPYRAASWTTAKQTVKGRSWPVARRAPSSFTTDQSGTGMRRISSGEPRRSIQGAYIRREARPGANLPARMSPETLARIGPLAKYAPVRLTGIGPGPRVGPFDRAGLSARFVPARRATSES